MIIHFHAHQFLFVFFFCVCFTFHAAWITFGQFETPYVENHCMYECPFTEGSIPSEDDSQDPSSSIDPIAWKRELPTYPPLPKTLFFDNFDIASLLGITTTIFRPPILPI